MPLRVSRERDLVEATRKLFDERGFRDAPVEEIAREVGIARGLIYRQFSSKEELFVLTVTDYLAELAAELESRDRGHRRPGRCGSSGSPRRSRGSASAIRRSSTARSR